MIVPITVPVESLPAITLESIHADGALGLLAFSP